MSICQMQIKWVGDQVIRPVITEMVIERLLRVCRKHITVVSTKHPSLPQCLPQNHLIVYQKRRCMRSLNCKRWLLEVVRGTFGRHLRITIFDLL